MNLQQIRDLVAPCRKACDELILKSLHSDVALIEQIGHYIIDSGGKRLRPLIVLLAAHACDYKGAVHIDLAAIIEFIHTATLLHDDVVDESTLRRGNETANAVWGDHASVLVGDFLYSRAFQMMVAINNMEVMRIMANTTNTISEGEVLQLLNAHDPDTTEARYFEVIKCKTAILFAAAAEFAGVFVDDKNLQQALYDYGLNLGITYQLIDDVLDYSASSEEMGKNVGDDLAEGKPTLPLIYAQLNASKEDAKLISTAIKDGRLDNLEAIQKIIQTTGAIDYTKQQAKHYAKKAQQALEALPDNQYRNALDALCTLLIDRTA